MNRYIFKTLIFSIVSALFLSVVLLNGASMTNGSTSQNPTSSVQLQQQTKENTQENHSARQKENMLEDETNFLDALFGCPIVALFSIIAIGLSIGKIKVKGLSLGAAGVLFVALFFGYMGYTIPDGIGTIGCVLFVFCLGLTAGPSFFSAFASKGKDFAQIAILAVLTGAATTYICAKLMHIPPALASGIFAGAMTSTPGLAAAMEASADNASMVSIGFGLAYPFGVITIVLFIQFIPKLFKIDLDREAEMIHAQQKKNSIQRLVVKVTNPAIEDKKIVDEKDFFDHLKCNISREFINGKFIPVSKDSYFAKDKIFLVVGDSEKLKFVADHIGKEMKIDTVIDSDNERLQIVLTSKEFEDKTIYEIAPLENYNVIISRVTRQDITFVPTSQTRLEYGDLLTVVGTPTDLQNFAKLAGNNSKMMHSTDIVSLAVGVAIGVLLGKTPIQLPGLKAFTLGMAGGPLFVALVMGYFKRIGKITTRIPVASKMLLMELGLLFFLASAGIKAGGSIIPVLREHGVQLLVVAVIIKTVPVFATFFLAFKVLKLNILEALGGMCGGMTSTPALGTITARVDSDIPVTSYATAYPVALIMITIVIQFLVSLLK